jgi:hypothetical protein
MSEPRRLHRLIYFSRQAFPERADIDHEVGLIIRASIANNRSLDVTGLLLVHQDWFVQVLEGGHEKVQTLYGKIAQDRRHAGATVIAAGAADGREFGDWNMCARRMSATDDAILDVLDHRGAFDPIRLNAYSALRLLRTVAQVQRRAA